jgi:sporulation integral membrane protein YtvI
MYKHWNNRIARLLFVAGIAAVCFFIIKYMFFLPFPLAAAALVAMCINPAVTLLEKKLYLPRSLAAALILISVFLFFSGAIILLIAELVQGTAYLADMLPEHFEVFTAFLKSFLDQTVFPYYDKLISFFNTLDTQQQTAITENMQQFITNISASGTLLLKNILLKLSAFLSKLPASLTIMAFIIIAAFLITNDWEHLKRFCSRLIPPGLASESRNIAVHLKKAFAGFFKAQAILISITACIIFIGLTVIKADHALTIALLAAGVDLLPYAGTGIIFIPWIIYVFLAGNYGLTISLAIIYIIITVSRQVMEPKILSVHVGIHPLAALIALFAGLKLWGAFGLVAAPLLLIVVHVLYQTGVFRQIVLFIKG